MKSSIIAAVVMMGAAGLANAEPVALTDGQMDGVTAGTFYNVYFNKYVNTNVTSYLNQDKYVDSAVNIRGQLADAEAAATCWGSNCFSETLTVTNTDYFGTSAYSQSISARTPSNNW
jgi:hypothetical protein